MTDIRIRLNQINADSIETSVFASKSEVNLVQDNVQALDNNVWVNSNDFTTYSTVTANTYNTYTDLSANDYSTYNTLSSLIDTVQDNVSSQSSNTSIVAGGTDLSNTTVFVEAGDGILLASNTTSKTMTIATSMSNVTSQTISIDGTANSFTLTKSAANANMILVMYNGLVQDPSRYTISGTTLTLNNVAPIIAGANVEVRYFDFFEQPGVSESSGGGGESSGGGGGGYTFQGENFGYASGGNTPSTSMLNTIDKFPFSSDSTAIDVGNLTQSRTGTAGQSSSTSGYTSGGRNPGAFTNIIDKFPFSSDTDATDVGNLTTTTRDSSGQSSTSFGYVSGGFPLSNTLINKFPFSSDTNATDVGVLTHGRTEIGGGQSSTSHGYASGGDNTVHTIDKFTFASDADATDVGELTQGRGKVSGQSSSESGYSSGGKYTNTVDKFSFSSDGNATDVGDLLVTLLKSSGQSSITSGYVSGGRQGPPSYIELNIIQKFPFSSDSNATDVGDLTQARRGPAGQQY